MGAGVSVREGSLSQMGLLPPHLQRGGAGPGDYVGLEGGALGPEDPREKRERRVCKVWSGQWRVFLLELSHALRAAFISRNAPQPDGRRRDGRPFRPLDVDIVRAGSAGPAAADRLKLRSLPGRRDETKPPP